MCESGLIYVEVASFRMAQATDSRRRCDITEGMSALPELAYRVQRGLLGRVGTQVASVRRETIAILNIGDTFSVAALIT